MKFNTRRDFFKSLTALGLMSFVTTAAYAKGSKELFEYQETPKDGKRCKECMHFLPETNECKVIEGSITPEGWCSLYIEAKTE
ncbi:MAG TPA: iron oxidase oxidoreductase [Epsilonproteobacteria bacterium]|nr:iron oxidase oxidoreductase [Campylobacterota bacterium]